MRWHHWPSPTTTIRLSRALDRYLSPGCVLENRLFFIGSASARTGIVRESGPDLDAAWNHRVGTAHFLVGPSPTAITRRDVPGLFLDFKRSGA